MAFLKLSTHSASRIHSFCRISAALFPSSKRFICVTKSTHADLNPMKHILKENNIPEADKRQIEREVEEMTKDWVTAGYHTTDKEEDNYQRQLVPFIFFTLLLCPIALLMYYAPDRDYSEWSWREAFLEIERRKRDGLPLVDKDLIPASQVKLPTDEELGSDFKIII
ncbi:unnamed protein product [Trichobilharzia szidati]|nr:unnamed protein product [Trichobilharzia szidati]